MDAEDLPAAALDRSTPFIPIILVAGVLQTLPLFAEFCRAKLPFLFRVSRYCRIHNP